MKYSAHLCLMGLLLVQCKQPAPHQQPEDSVVTAFDTDHTIQSSAPVPPATDTEPMLVIPDTASIVPGVFVKKMNYESNDVSAAFCNKWKLDSAALVAIIRGFKPINSNSWHYGFNSYDCELVGDVRISGVNYRMYLNAGSWFFLYKDEIHYRFGDEKNAFNKYFLEGNVYDEMIEDN